MLFGLNVTDTVFYTGGACYLIPFYSNVWAHLENGRKGSRFPYIMNELYDGVLSYEHVLPAIDELAQIEEELKKIPASRYIYDFLEPQKQKPDGMKVNEAAVNLYDSLINDDRVELISVIRRAFVDARIGKNLVWIGNPVEEKDKPKLAAGTVHFLYVTEGGLLVLDRYFGNIERITVPGQWGGVPVEKIADRAFSENTDVKEVILPDSVKMIGDGCFWNCSALERITTGNRLECIGNMAFRNCTSLNYIHFSRNLRAIESKAFFGCSALLEVHLQDGVESIGDEAFAECSHLTRVILPAGLKDISDTAFLKSRKNLTIIAPSGSVGADYAKKRRIKWASGPQ